MTPVPPPTAAEWATAGTAAVLVAAVAALLLVRPHLRRASGWARLAGYLLAVQAAGTVLVVAVLVGAGVRAGQLGDPPLAPPGPFPARLIDVDPSITQDVARYGAALLLPLALVLGVLAVAVLRTVRGSWFRLVAGAVSGLALAGSAIALLGEASSPASGVAAALGACSLGVVVGLVADELR